MQTRTIICGLTAGALCAFGLRMTFLLAWPAQYLADWSNLPVWVAWLGPVFSALVIVVAAWISAAWEWKETKAEAIRVGAATGFLALSSAYLLAGSSIAGLLGLEPMLKHGLAPIADQELVKTLTADVVINTMRSTHLILWGSIGFGVLLGAIGGLLAPLTGLKLGLPPKRLSGRLLVWPFAFLLIFTPLIAEVAVQMIAAFNDDLRFIWEYASTSPLLPFMTLPLGSQLGFMALGLGAVWPWLVRWWQRGSSCFVVFLSLIVGLGSIYTLYQAGIRVIDFARSGFSNFDDPFLTFRVTVLFSLLYLAPVLIGFLLGRWLFEKPLSVLSQPPPCDRFFDYLVVSIWMGLAAILPSWGIVSYTLNLIMGAISMLRSIAGEFPYEKPLKEIVSLMISTPLDYVVKAFLPFLIVLGLISIGLFAILGGKEREFSHKEKPAADEKPLDGEPTGS
jgi:hypothetical protein